MNRYPGFSAAYAELVSVIARQVESEETWPLIDWITREMHAASAEEIAELLDRACAEIVSAVPDYQRRRVLAHLEAIRARTRDTVAAEISGRGNPEIAIDALHAVVRAVDPSLVVHLNAVGTLARRIATELRLDPIVVRDVGNAGRLLDVGIIAVPQERRDHPLAGSQIAGEIETLKQYAPWIRAHHERLDGSGYPDGLRETEIPIPARVLAVADVFVAMTSERPHRCAHSPHTALEYLGEHSGTAFDARAVSALTRLLAERRTHAGGPAAA